MEGPHGDVAVFRDKQYFSLFVGAYDNRDQLKLVAVLIRHQGVSFASGVIMRQSVAFAVQLVEIVRRSSVVGIVDIDARIILVAGILPVAYASAAAGMLKPFFLVFLPKVKRIRLFAFADL